MNPRGFYGHMSIGKTMVTALRMKLSVTLVMTWLALSLGAVSNHHVSNDKGRDAKPSNRQHETKQGGKPGQDQRRDRDRDHDNGNDKDHHHDPKDCADDRHDHCEPKPPKPPCHDATVPAAPTNLLAAAIGEFQINLTWTDNATNELGFKIERSLDGTNFTQIAQVLPDTTSYRDLNRFPDTKYFYRARAFNAKGNSGYTATARSQTPAPACKLVASMWGNQGVVPAFDLSGVVGFAPSQHFVVFLRKDGGVFQWDYTGLTNVSGLTNIAAIAAGGAHGLALRLDGTVVGWGDNYKGQAAIPVGLTNVTAIAAGGMHSLALKGDGTVVAWGDDELWQARPPAGLTGVVAIAAGYQHSLAMRSDGTVVGWGFNDKNAAQPPAGLRDVVAIAAGFHHSLALRSDGTVVGWGLSDAAVTPSNLTQVIEIAAGIHESLALGKDGSLVYWGSGQYSYPRPPSGIKNITRVASGNGANLVLGIWPAPASSPLAKLVTPSQVELTWQDYSEGTAAFEIWRGRVNPGEIYGGSYSFPTNASFRGGVSAGTTRFLDNDIVAGETYWYQINSRNECGVTTNEQVAAITIVAPLNSPRLGTPYVSGDMVLLNWNAEMIGATRYHLERAPDAADQPGVWQEIANLEATFHSWYSGIYTDTNLPPNSTNWYRIRAENALGISPYSDPVRAIIIPPAAPSSLSLQTGGTNQVILNWYGDLSPAPSGFKIERADDAGNVPGVWEEIDSIRTPNGYPLYYTNHGVIAGQAYWYRLRAFNAAGLSDYSQPVPIAVTLAPPSLGIVTRSNAVLLAVWLPWSNYTTPIASFAFERARDTETTPGRWQPISLEPLNNQSWFIDRGLSTNVFTYRYRAKVLTWLGWSDYSEMVGTVISPPQPPPLLIARVGNTNRISLSWWLGFNSDAAGFVIERARETAAGLGDWNKVGTAGLTNSYHYNFDDVVTFAERGRTYRYRISAFNAAGQSMFIESQPVTLTPPEVISFSASADQNQVMLGWAANYFGAMGFELQRASDATGSPGTWAEVAKLALAQTSSAGYLDRLPLMPAKYWYRVRASNWLGQSQFSDPILVEVRPPLAPVSFQARIASTNQVQLRWEHYGGDVVGFQIERAPVVADQFGEWRELARLPRANYVGEYLDTNVQAFAAYGYRLRAYNEIGLSPYTEVLSVPITPPPAPTALQVQFTGDRVDLKWQSTGSIYDYGEMDGYDIQRAPDANGAPAAWVKIGQVASANFTFTDAQPIPDATSWYRVRAVNWVGGSDYSLPVRVAVVPPPVPDQLSARIGKSNQVELVWYEPWPNQQNGFSVEFAEDVGEQPGNWQQLDWIAATNFYTAQYIHTNAAPWVTNWYRVRAAGAGGVSAPSAALRFVVAPPPLPSSLSGGQFADQITLKWVCYTAGQVDGFRVERAVETGGGLGAWESLAVTSATNSFSGYWYSRHEDSGLSADTIYWYRVRASNWVGDSEPSTAIFKKVLGPAPPRSVNGSVGETNHVYLGWFPGTADAAGYYLERAVDMNSAPGAWQQIATIQSPDFMFGFDDTNLTWFATNRYRLRAFNALGVSPYSQVFSIGIVPPPPPQVDPVVRFADQARVSWLSPAIHYGFVAGFKVQRAPDVAGVPGAWAEVYDDTQSSAYWGYRTFTDTNLTPHATYWYRVCSYNWLGQGVFSPPRAVVIRSPDAPVQLSTRITSSNQIELFWTAVEPYDQDIFLVERTTNTNELWAELATLPATNQAFAGLVDPSALPNIRYHYRVRSANVVGISSPSEMTTAIITLPTAAALVLPPLRIHPLTLMNHDVLVSWETFGGTINVVEGTANGAENFEPISPPLRIVGAGSVVTNFLDVGALTNAASRFYRIRVVP